MSARAEADDLIGIAHIRPALEILALEPGHIDQHLLRRGVASQRRDVRGRVSICATRTSHGFSSQVVVVLLGLHHSTRGSRLTGPMGSNVTLPITIRWLN